MGEGRGVVMEVVGEMGGFCSGDPSVATILPPFPVDIHIPSQTPHALPSPTPLLPPPFLLPLLP